MTERGAVTPPPTFFDPEHFTDTKTEKIPFGVARKGATIEIENLSKSFGTRMVLDSFSISIAAGTVHGLLGANGSGKSTAIKILAGYHEPDGAGAVLTVQGERHPFPLSYSERRDIGLAFVHQDLGLAGDISVTENLFIDELASRPLTPVRWRQLHTRASDLLARVGAGHIDPHRSINQLFPVDRAIVAVARAMSKLQPGGLLVLDEVTTFLPRDSIELLFDLVRQVCAAGMSVLFVSHRLEEVRALCTSATVLRAGEVVASRDMLETTDAQLVTDIVGDELSALYPPKRQIGTRTSLVVTDVKSRALGPVSFTARSGEIIGITGLRGMGQEHLPYVLYGDAEATGSVDIDGTTIDLHSASPRDLLNAGVRLVPGDRLAQGAVPSATVEENVTLPYVREFFRAGLLRRPAERADTQTLLNAYGVAPADPTYAYGRLSGGNQQKVLMARWLRTTPTVLLLDEPTQGVDVGARRELFERIVRVAEEGGTVIYVSTETQDLAELCHRVLVFRDGQIASVVDHGFVTEENILRACWLNEAA